MKTRFWSVVIALAMLAVVAADTIVSQLGNEGPAYEQGSRPSTLGWGADDASYPDRCVVNPADDAEMVWVPPGSFRMGITEEERDRLWDANGWDPNWNIRETVPDDNPTPEADPPYAKVPARVSWFDAEFYGEWAGGDFVTEAQREWAARGPENLLWPWGNEWDSSQCNSGNYWAG